MKVLIVRLGAIGDVVRALPVIQVLRSNIRDLGLFWLVGKRASGVLEGEEIDETIVFEASTLFKIRRYGRFDLVIDLQGLFKSALLASLFKAGEVVGPSEESGIKEPSYIFYGKRIALDPNLNRVHRNLELLKSLGFYIPDGIRFSAAIPHTSIREAERILNGYKAKSPLIFVHPGSSPKTPYKRWPEERYGKLCFLLATELGAHVLLTHGSAFELSVCRRVSRISSGTSQILPRIKRIKTLFALYSMGDIFIGNDTGPMHIASFSGTNVLGVFGPTNVLVNRPVGEGICEVVYRKVPCSPCRNRSCEKGLCFEKIDERLVLERAKSILERRRL